MKLTECAAALNFKLTLTLMEHQESLFSMVKFAHTWTYVSAELEGNFFK